MISSRRCRQSQNPILTNETEVVTTLYTICHGISTATESNRTLKVHVDAGAAVDESALVHASAVSAVAGRKGAPLTRQLPVRRTRRVGGRLARGAADGRRSGTGRGRSGADRRSEAGCGRSGAGRLVGGRRVHQHGLLILDIGSAVIVIAISIAIVLSRWGRLLLPMSQDSAGVFGHPVDFIVIGTRLGAAAFAGTSSRSCAAFCRRVCWDPAVAFFTQGLWVIRSVNGVYAVEAPCRLSSIVMQPLRGSGKYGIYRIYPQT